MRKKIFLILLSASIQVFSQIIPQKIDLYSSSSSVPAEFIQYNNHIYFTSIDGFGRELRKSDGSLNGTSLIKDMTVAGSSYPRNLILFNNELFFTIGNAINSDELWKTDGTEAGTVLVKDVNPSGLSLINNAIVFNNELYFDADDGSNGIELWKTDGTDAGTVMVKDINSSSGGSSRPENFTVFNNELYFSADDGTNGTELWKTDGTEVGTVLLKDIFTGDNFGTPNSSSPSNLIVFNNKLFFTAEDDANGKELWKTDGTEAGTEIENDILEGGGSSNPQHLTIFDNQLFFSANNGVNGQELWASYGNGITAGTRMVADISTGSSIPSNLTVSNNELYFKATNGVNGFELWKIDTGLNSSMVKDIRTGVSSSNPANLISFNNFLYFVADSSLEGIELWKSDGTEAGTVIVSDIYPGSSDSNPSELTVINNALYFSARDGSNDTELYRHSYENIFTGSTSSLWSLASNWENSTVPSSNSDVLISNGTFPFIDVDDISINSLEIQNDVTLNLLSSKEITISNNFLNNGTVNILSDASSSGSIIINGSASGNITYKRFISTDWHLIASPFEGETIEDIITNTDLATGTESNLGFAPYNNSYSGTTGWEYVTSSSSGNIASGQGFAIKKSAVANATVDFTGTYKTDDLTNYDIPNGSQNAWNLIGNPYPSFISINTLADATNNFLSENTSQLEDAFNGVYFWNPTTSSYDVANLASSSAEYIAPGQGFFVHAKTSGGNRKIKITEAMQSHQSADIFNKQNSQIPEINIFLSDDKSSKKTTIKYIAGATTGLDSGYDAGLFSGTTQSFSIYSHLVSEHNGTNLMLQVLPISNYEDMIIPIGIIAEKDKQIKFTTTHLNLPNDIDVYIEDRLENTFTNLTDNNTELSINLNEAINGTGRFYLHTTSRVLSTDSTLLNPYKIYVDNNCLNIIGLQNNSKIELFSILGKQLISENTTINNTYSLKLPSVRKGLYIVKITTDNKTITQKIIL